MSYLDKKSTKIANIFVFTYVSLQRLINCNADILNTGIEITNN